MSNTNLSIKYRIKADVILKSKNAVIRLHSIVTEFMNKAFRFKKNESTCDILYSNWYNISIIIPMLNEADHIGNLLTHLLENSSKENIAEIIIADGGSTDGSLDIVSKYKSIKLLNAPKGRAKQMNLGAKYATGSILYFLHADSFPPKNFDTLIINEVKKNNEAGCFRMTFNSNHLWLKLTGQLTRLPWRICRGGDQSQFITTTLFNNIGGFNEDFIIYEDNDLIAKLYDRNQFVVIQKWLTTSARCYCVNGVWKLQYYYWRIHLKKWMGADANELNRYYKKHVC